jgi:AI-2 transport protein TqsA
VQTDLQTTLLVALSYLIVDILIGNILEPRIMGRGLGISTLAVFLSLLFWGWVLGTVGVFWRCSRGYSRSRERNPAAHWGD